MWATLISVALTGCSIGRTSIAALVQLDTATRFQTFSGWEAGAQAGQEVARSYRSYRDTLLELAVNDLGITRLRIELRSGFENPVDLWAEQRSGRVAPSRCGRYATVNDNDDALTINPAGFHFSELDWTIEQLVLPMKRLLAARGEKLFLNATYVSFMKQCPRGTRYDHATPAEYAEFVLASYLHLRDKYGLEPDAWEVILEPENTWYWRGREIGEAIVATAKLLEQHGFKPRFIAPSTTKAANAPRYFEDMMAVPGASKYLAEFSYHRYRGFTPADFVEIGRRAAQYHVNTAMLEHIGADYDELHEDLKVAGVSAWQQFVLAYPSKEDDGAQYYLVHDADSGHPSIRLGGRTRYIRQYSRYIRPGAVRIHASSSIAGVDPVAFVGQDLPYAVVMKCAGPARITISGLPKGSYAARYTTARATDVAAAVRPAAAGIEVSIPAKGVITLFSAAGQRNF